MIAPWRKCLHELGAVYSSYALSFFLILPKA
jgi:hypothetical protein